MAHMTFADLERRIRTGSYGSYPAACVAIGRSRDIESQDKQTLKELAHSILKEKKSADSIPVPVRSEPTPIWYTPPGASVPPTGHEEADWFQPLDPKKAAEVGLEPDVSVDGGVETVVHIVQPRVSLQQTAPRSVFVDEPHKYRDIREMRDALAEKLAELDRELENGAREVAQEAFRDQLHVVLNGVEQETIRDWDDIVKATPENAAIALADHASRGTHCVADVLRVLAIMLVRGAPLIREVVPEAAESAA